MTGLSAVKWVSDLELVAAPWPAAGASYLGTPQVPDAGEWAKPHKASLVAAAEGASLMLGWRKPLRVPRRASGVWVNRALGVVSPLRETYGLPP